MKQCLIFFLVSLMILAGAMTGQAKAEKTTIKYGVAGPMKFAWGKNMLAGVEVAVEEVNAASGRLRSLYSV
jgi:ABC-type branched-subunit amino acid transport system substrate-binding protein